MKRLLVFGMMIMALGCLLAVPAFSADKLIVKDSTGTNTVFDVTDDGTTHVSADGTTVNPKIIVDGAADSQTVKPMISFYRARGTHASPAPIQNNDWLGQFTLNGYNGGAGGYEGERRVFQVEASENWTPTAGGYRFTFYTRPNGTLGAPTARVVFDQDGTVKVNGLAGTYINGSAYVCVNNSGVIFASETPCP